MKKLFFAASLLMITLSVLLISCEKEPGSVTNNSTTVNCADSAYLLADSVGCTGVNIFYVLGKNKRIAVAKGNNVAIDTVTRGGFYYLTYDSIGGSTNCSGATYINASLSCSQRK